MNGSKEAPKMEDVYSEEIGTLIWAFEVDPKELDSATAKIVHNFKLDIEILTLAKNTEGFIDFLKAQEEMEDEDDEP